MSTRAGLLIAGFAVLSALELYWRGYAQTLRRRQPIAQIAADAVMVERPGSRGDRVDDKRRVNSGVRGPQQPAPATASVLGTNPAAHRATGLNDARPGCTPE